MGEAASMYWACIKIAQAILFLTIVAINVMMLATFTQATIRVENLVKHATTLIEQEKLDEAEDLLKQTITQVSDKHSLPLRNLIATLFQSRQDFVAEAVTYHDILQITPDNVEVERTFSFAILRMGAPDLATDYVTETSHIFTAKEIHYMQQTQAGRLIKWGEIGSRYGIAQF